MTQQQEKALIALLENHFPYQPFYGDWEKTVKAIYKVTNSLKQTFWYFFPDDEDHHYEVKDFYKSNIDNSFKSITIKSFQQLTTSISNDLDITIKSFNNFVYRFA